MKRVGNHDKNGAYFNVAVSEILINNFSKCPCDLFLARGYNFVTLGKEVRRYCVEKSYDPQSTNFRICVRQKLRLAV